MGTFIDDCLIKTRDESDRISTDHIHDIYIQWCMKNKFQQKLSANQLTRKFVAHGFEKQARVNGKTCSVLLVLNQSENCKIGVADLERTDLRVW